MDVLFVLLLTVSLVGFVWKIFAKWISQLEPVRDAVLAILTNPEPHGSWNEKFSITINKLSQPKIFLRVAAPIPIFLSIIIVIVLIMISVIVNYYPDYLNSQILFIMYLYFIAYIANLFAAPWNFAISFFLYMIFFLIFVVCSIFILKFAQKMSFLRSLLVYSASSVVSILAISLIYYTIFRASFPKRDLLSIPGAALDLLLQRYPQSCFTCMFSYEKLSFLKETSLEIIRKDDDGFSIIVLMMVSAEVVTVFLFLVSLSFVTLLFLGYYIGFIFIKIDLSLRIKFGISSSRIEEDPVGYFSEVVTISVIISIIPLLIFLFIGVYGLYLIGY